MEQMEFKKLLLESALYLMSCDSEIADFEINELKEIANKTTYFVGLDINAELNSLLPHFKKTGEIITEKYFHILKTSDLSVSQELLLLEIILRISHSDKKLSTQTALNGKYTRPASISGEQAFTYSSLSFSAVISFKGIRVFLLSSCINAVPLLLSSIQT